MIVYVIVLSSSQLLPVQAGRKDRRMQDYQKMFLKHESSPQKPQSQFTKD